MRRNPVLLIAPLLLASCAPSMMAPNAGTTDGLFLQAITGSNLFEIQSSQVALSKATTPALKAYAQHLIDDHQKAQAMVSTLAAARGVPLPKVLPPELMLKVNTLAMMDGAAFEKAYLQEQVVAHQFTLSLLQNEQLGGKDAAVVAFANEQVGPIQEHLAQAQAMMMPDGAVPMNH
ncbi:DUF4142 domain-containing protein [Deinococcus hopiensis]|uniref:Putative membrane protein n=1 Tax=Deinococcus hopiensis KR-140 TaxID=695939 RepID=A0A1W1V8W5_9DEIO|nr:DUF4142 domain-containing protein [Deinococcus hopiensis]SMB89812.1 putative membrane protein [Deinococcus hopiensis KR-140]